MAIIMPIPRDVRKVKTKFIGPFTKRQFCFIVPAGVLAFAINAATKKAGMQQDIAMYLILVATAPLIAFGYLDIYDMPSYIFLKNFLEGILLGSSKKVYHTENVFAKLAEWNRITYAYFDGDLSRELSAKEKKKKARANRKRFKKYMREHPEMKPIL